MSDVENIISPNISKWLKIEICLNNVVILFFLHIVIMVIFDTGLYSMHTIFIMKYLCLILENKQS